ncbi:hypothetical protein Plano_2937 [Planococcus sp. PAMC 21323]|uniref:protein phosphatase 2C domain-containing protein n=1 Tax=Planococcus sp. PAMC 21323 TaxID=1526927 RepID=UPI00056DD3BB|nr:protein phosphatase 2C domain-containing protein [Planococcus sp. PAMC 21323]AIY06902.1 hypothetical protein Plano_2937 [Planococcus sp. PAMC 21323]
MDKQLKAISWIGSENSFIDKVDVLSVQHITLGRFGGNSASGQTKNEDGCLIWLSREENWEFVAVLDAHHSAKSAELVTEQLEKNKEVLTSLLSNRINGELFKSLETALLALVLEQEFLEKCRHIQGETALLIAIRKGKYLYWFSVGDCLLYVFHPELAAFDQYQINQRQFYEWIGKVNTFEKSVPCFSSGIRELRRGKNQLLLTTDGLVECPGDVFAEPKSISQLVSTTTVTDGVTNLLKTIEKNHVRDSTTVVSWTVDVTEQASYASNQ